MPTIEDLLKILKSGGGKKITEKNLILSYLKRQKPNYDLVMIRLAFDYAKDAHKNQRRKSGDDYINHPLRTAMTLANMGMDQSTIIAGLLHDVPEDTDINLVDIEKNFGPEVAKLVAGITKLGVLKYRGIEKYAENLRKMFVSMAQDIRIVMIKMADRLDNLRTLVALPKEKQERIARESLEIYAPIANRLGMGFIKGELEDLAFPYLYPEKYQWLKDEVMPKMDLKLEYLQTVIKEVRSKLKEEKLKVIEIYGRKKRLYSLFLKLQRPQYKDDPEKVFDLVAVRIIVPTVADCYHALGIVHKLWKPVSGRIKDFISQPKPNGYQSLHTTVFCFDGKIVEFQIRTPDMQQQAEYGIAAHWFYKESPGSRRKVVDKDHALPKKFNWIQDLVSWQKNIADNKQYLDTLSVDFFKSRFFIFTPKGDVIDLPEGATPIDFAYHVHTWIGDHCSGARINNQIASLDAKLKNGDMVEIITDKNRKGPSRDWMGFAKTHAAKNKIKSALSKTNIAPKIDY